MMNTMNGTAAWAALIAALCLLRNANVDAFATNPPVLAKTSLLRQDAIRLLMSDVTKDEADEASTPESPTAPSSTKDSNPVRRKTNNNNNDWLPQPPEDHLTLSGDIASLFLYAFMDHFLNDVYLASILASSTSAADAAHNLDPSGTEIVLTSTPVWLDPTVLGPHVSDQVLFSQLQSQVMPHFTPVLASAGVASVTMASCWLLAGIFHQAFHFRNTIDCSTHRAIAVTGKTWVTSCILLIVLATSSQHLSGVIDISAMSTSVLMMEGRVMNPVEEWFSVLSRSDADYIFNSLGVLLTWRFLISFLLGGWSKK